MRERDCLTPGECPIQLESARNPDRFVLSRTTELGRRHVPLLNKIELYILYLCSCVRIGRRWCSETAEKSVQNRCNQLERSVVRGSHSWLTQFGLSAFRHRWGADLCQFGLIIAGRRNELSIRLDELVTIFERLYTGKRIECGFNYERKYLLVFSLSYFFTFQNTWRA